MNLKSMLKAVGRYTLSFIAALLKRKKVEGRRKKCGTVLSTILLTSTFLLLTLLTGCAGLDQADHQTTTTVWAVGVPGVAILRDSRVSPDNRGTSTTTATQVNTLDVEPKVK